MEIILQDWEYENKINRLKETVKHLELARITAYQELQSLISELKDAHPLEAQSFPSQIIRVKDFDVYQIVLPDILPLYDERDRKYLKDLKDYYLSGIINTIRYQKTKISYDKAFILIHQFFPDLTIRDLDNRNKRFIFNGLRQGRIIKDDSWMEMEYLEKGSLDRMQPRTEIYLCEREKKIELLNYIDMKLI